MHHSPNLCVCLCCSFLFVVMMAFVMLAPDTAAEEASVSERDVPQKPSREPAPVLRFKGGFPEQLPIPGDPRPYAGSPYATQIDKALAFLAFKDRDSNRNYRLVLLDYMQRKFGLHNRYSLKATRAPHLPDVSSEDLGNMKRLTDPDYMVEPSVIEEPLSGTYRLEGYIAIFIRRTPLFWMK